MEVVEGTASVADPGAFVERLQAVGDEHDATIQAFDARYVVDRDHLERAVALADRAIDRGENVARDRAMEIMCYVAGRRQIQRALETGVSVGECPADGLVDGGDEAAAADAVGDLLDPAETLGEYDPDRVAEYFEIGEGELAATGGGYPELVRERVALLDVEK
jgi:KEOPS complex subunit Cgi121